MESIKASKVNCWHSIEMYTSRFLVLFVIVASLGYLTAEEEGEKDSHEILGFRNLGTFS